MPESFRSALTPPATVPDYELVRCIGKGSYGEVWLARSITGNYRAVKIILRSSFTDARPFDREFLGIQRFEPVSHRHPGLVSVLHVGRNETAGHFHYVMELADDIQSGQRIEVGRYVPKTLSHVLAERRTLPIAQAIELGIALTEALGYLHSCGLVHRDIKPSNIIFVNGVPKFADVGLVAEIGLHGSYVGTAGYIPPEGPGSVQADLYSLGKVLYQVATGLGDETFPELPPGDASELAQYIEVVLQACELDFRRRYQTAAEMQNALRSIRVTEPAPAQSFIGESANELKPTEHESSQSPEEQPQPASLASTRAAGPGTTTFGDYETVGEPVSVTEEGGHVSTIWKARKIGGTDPHLFAIKCFAAGRRRGGDSSQETLEEDHGLEFLETVKQLKKASTERGKTRSDLGQCLASIHDFGSSTEGAWYRTDFYQRNTNSLKAWVAVRGMVDSAALRHVVYSIVTGCLALQRSCGRSHGNLKPSNVLLAGKPRQPLRKTPIHLIDPLPASLFRAPELDKSDRESVLQLIREISEIQDLQAIGLIILQLVEGRDVRSDSYNYPIDRSSKWDKLGKEGEQWRGRCNRLLNPNLSLIDVNLESLAKELRPNPFSGKSPLVIVIIAVIGFGWLSGSLISSSMGKSRQAKFQSSMAAARQNLDALRFEEAKQEIGRALKLKPDDPDARQMQSAVETKVEAEYQRRLSSGRKALTDGRFSEAAQAFDNALRLRAGDRDATTLAAQARDSEKRATLTANYALATDNGKLYLESGDYAGAASQYARALALAGELNDENKKRTADNDVRYATALNEAKKANEGRQAEEEVAALQKALQSRPADSLATKMLADAQTRLNQAQREAQRERSYSQALDAAKAALRRNEYANAIDEANVALGFKQNDNEATKVKTDAERAQAEMQQQRERQQNYSEAIAAARSALEARQYANAIAQAARALSFKANDAKATELRDAAEQGQRELLTQAERDRNYKQAMDLARSAFKVPDYAKAVAQASTALGFRTNDPAAQQLKEEAEQLEAERLAQAEREKKYTLAMESAQSALSRGDYTNAISLSDAALSIKTNDTPAKALKAMGRAQAERNETYKQAMTAARSALAAKDYTNAIAQANTALSLGVNNREAAEFKLQAQQQQMSETLVLGNTYLQQTNYLAANRQFKTAADLADTLKDSAKQKDAKEGVRYTDLLVQADKARSDQSIEREIASLQEAEGLRSVGFVRERLAGLKQTQTENKEFNRAKAALNEGDYPEANRICEQFRAQPRFQAVAKEVHSHMERKAAVEGMLDEGRFSDVPSADQLPTTAAFTNLLKKAENASKSYEAALLKFRNGTSASSFINFITNQPYAKKPLFTGRLQEAEDYVLAEDYYRKSDYDAALKICRLHPSTNPFQPFAGRLQAEQTAFNDSKTQFAQGDYSFIGRLESLGYTNGFFAELLGKGRGERTSEIQLEELKQQGWRAVQAAMAKLSDETKMKSRFRAFDQWTQQQAQQEQIVEEKDTVLKTLMVMFAVKPARGAKLSTNGVKATALESLSESEETRYKESVEKLRDFYQKHNFLDLERKDDLERVSKGIRNLRLHTLRN